MEGRMTLREGEKERGGGKGERKGKIRRYKSVQRRGTKGEGRRRRRKDGEKTGRKEFREDERRREKWPESFIFIMLALPLFITATDDITAIPYHITLHFFEN